MKRVLITHVGVSVLSNRALTNFYTSNLTRLHEDLRRNINRPDALKLVKRDLERGLGRVWDRNYTSEEQQRREDSPAEIAALSVLGIQPGDRVVLLHSDTAGGRFCGELLKHALTLTSIATDTGYPCCVPSQLYLQEVEGLKISDDSAAIDPQTGVDPQSRSATFVRFGMVSYVDRIWGEYTSLLAEGGGALIFNVTSGYKGLVPIASDLALLLNAYARQKAHPIRCTLCYLYQNSDALIWYGTLPVTIDWSVMSRELLSRLEDASTSPGIVAGRPAPEEEIYFEDNPNERNHKQLSPLGAVTWALLRKFEP